MDYQDNNKMNDTRNTQRLHQIADLLQSKGYGARIFEDGIDVYLDNRPLTLYEVRSALNFAIDRRFTQLDVTGKGRVLIREEGLRDENLDGDHMPRLEILLSEAGELIKAHRLETLLDRARAIAALAQTTYRSAEMDALAQQLAEALQAYEEA